MSARRLSWLGWLLALLSCAEPTTPFTLSGVSPDVVQTELGATLFVVGTGFRPLLTFDFDRPDASVVVDEFVVSLSDGRGSIRLPGATRLDERRLTVDAPRGLPVGDYDVVVVDPHGATATLVGGLRVSACGAACVADAGRDAGGADAAGFDSGAPDAGGTDAGLGDAGPSDAGPPDAGDDAGSPDAGTDAGSDGGSDGGTDAGAFDAGCSALTYADDDGDGVGRAGTQAMVCGPGRAPTGDDCDDADEATFPDAGEVCNGVDDDCDGQLDEGVCAQPLAWLVLDAGTTDDLRYVSSWSAGAATVASATRLFRVGPAGSDELVQACPSTVVGLSAVSSGSAYLAGATGGVTHAYEILPAEPRCRQLVAVGSTLHVFRLLRGQQAGAGVDDDGRLSTWPRTGNFRRFPGSALPGSVTLSSLSGSGLSQLHAVGWSDVGSVLSPRVYRWAGGPAMWADELVQNLPGAPPVALRDVVSFSDDRAVAVGDDGTLFDKRDGGWRLAFTNPDAGHFQGVHGFSRRRVYVASSKGQVFRWNGQRLDLLHTLDGGPDLRALHGVSEDALWVVGARGYVATWR